MNKPSLKPRQMQQTIQVIVVAIMGLMMAACGGSLGSDSKNTDKQQAALRVSIGDDASYAEKSVIPMTAFVQGDNAPFTYQWSTQPTEYNDALSATDAEELTFTAPEVITNTDILLTLSVTDSQGNVSSDQKFVTVTAISTPPLVTLARNVSGEVSFSIDSGESFELLVNWTDGEDGTDVKSAMLLVEQLSGSPLSNLPSDGIYQVFTPSQISPPILQVIAQNEFVNLSTEPVQLSFRLLVEDNSGLSAETEIRVDINSAASSKPVVDAGVDQVVYEGQVVTLNGATNASSNIWQQVSGSPIVSIDNANQVITRFNAPIVNETTTFEFKLTAYNTATNGANNDTVKVTVLSISAFDGINDTGIINCANELSNQAACSLGSFPNQDAENGRDAAFQANSLSKTGMGELGFDFTKLDANGDEIATGTADCIRDNVTGLIWEVKQASGFRAYNSRFSWYSTNETSNGLLAGTADGGVCTTLTGILDSCDTTSYVTAVNNTGLCGANDWRLPTVKELTSILNFARLNDKFARQSNGDEIWPQHASGIYPYWSSQPSMFGITSGAMNAWAIDTATGNEYAHAKSNSGYVLLVRGE